MMQGSPFQHERSQIAAWEPRIHALVDWDGELPDEHPPLGSAPLAGWSVAIKDIIDVAGMPTACNAPFVTRAPKTSNAGIVDLLEAAGATVLAKAVTTAFAYYDPGPTRNPWNPDHTPGGSSSGSAAAVACGMVRLSIGTQTVGSINRPASYCGVVGFKPSFGVLPVDGVFPLSAYFDTVGLFTRGVTDAEHAFAAITGQTAHSVSHPLRVAVVEDMLGDAAEAPMLQAVRSAGTQLEAMGHEVRAIRLPDALRTCYENHWELTASGAADAHAELFKKKERRYPPELRALIARGHDVTPDDINRIQRHRDDARDIVGRIFADWDVVLSPSAPGAAPFGIKATGNPRMNLLWTYVGVPALTVPAALTEDRLPLGVQLTSAQGTDLSLLAAGRRVEEAVGFDSEP